MSGHQATAALDPPIEAPIAPIPASQTRPPPVRGILRESRTYAAPWYARDFVSAINQRLEQQGVPVKVPPQAGSMWSSMMKRIGVKEQPRTPPPKAAARASPPHAGHEAPTGRHALKQVRFRYEDLAHTYPITSTTAPGAEHTTRSRVDRERAEHVAALRQRPWSPPELISLYRICCRIREENVNVAIIKTLDQARDWNSTRSLNFSGVPLGDSFAPLADLLGIPLGIQALVFDGCGLHSKAVRALSHALCASGSVCILGLANNSVTRDGWDALGLALQYGHVQSLDVSGNMLNKQSIHALLRPQCPLVSLRLDHCSLRTSVIEDLADTLRHTKVRHLSLRRNKITVLSADALALILQDFAGTDRHIVAAADAEIVAPADDVYTSEPGAVVGALLNGKADSAAEEARAARIAVLVDRARAMQRALSRAPCISTLLTLDIKSNQLRSGIAPLAAAMRHNRTLRVLNLSDNELDEGSLALLCSALRYNTTLETLDVSCNPCCGPSLQGIAALREALAVHPRLKRVFLSMSGFASEAALALAECFVDAHTLIHLDITANPGINMAGLLALELGLRMSDSIRCVDVDISEDADVRRVAHDIYTTCQRNTNRALENASTETARRQATAPLRKSSLALALGKVEAAEPKPGQTGSPQKPPTSVPDEPAEPHGDDPPSAGAAHANELGSEEGTIFRRAQRIGLLDEDSAQAHDDKRDKSGNELLRDMLK